MMINLLAANPLAPNLLAQGGEIDNTTMFGLILAVLVFGVLLIFLFIFTRYFGLWIQSQLTRADISFFNLLGMTFRKTRRRHLLNTRAASSGSKSSAETSNSEGTQTFF